MAAPGEFWAVYISGMKIAVVIALAVGTVVTVFETMRYRLEETTLALKTKELERQRALNAATAARLASLESRVHPHFLFNALNSISSLIPEDPKRAERLVERMAALLRFSLDTNHAGLVAFQSEIKIVTDYLEIEKARFGERLRYTLDVPDGCAAFEVPPFAVQTLVENSVKYAVGSRVSGADIQVAARNGGNRLTIEVTDTGPGFRPDAIKVGHGLDSLNARLKALFGRDGTLEINSGGGRTVVGFSVPRNREEEVKAG
jgi:LytS/YehU family sensor histidine kinase